MKPFLLFPFLILFPLLSHAEYRVFILQVSKPNPIKGQPPLTRTVESNLDPFQYRDYYPVQSDESIEYIDTWMCYGRTDNFQDFCPKPAPPQKAQIPSAPVSNPSGA